jgi:hypothetical protein
MVQTLLLGALAGGIAAFAWGAVSWMLLSWHHSTFLPFLDEDAVARVIAENAPESGVYGLPAPPTSKGMSRDEREAAEAAVWEKMQRGPVVMAIIQRQTFSALAKPMLTALCIYVLASLIFTWLLLQTTGLGYWKRVLFVAFAALAGAVICRLLDWNWHGYSTRYTAVAVADAFLGWFLTGLVIAAVARP